MSATEQLYHRMMMAFGRGFVTAVSEKSGTQMLQVKLGSDETRDNTPRRAEYGFASSPLPGAQVIAIFMGGDRSNGAVIATDDPRYRLAGMKGGEVGMYDDLGQCVYLTRSGIVIKGAGLPINVQNSPQVIVTNGDVIADGISLKTHRHSDPQGGDTGEPISMTVSYSPALKSARMQLVIDAIDGGGAPGTLEICTANYVSVLATIPLALPSFTLTGSTITMALPPRTDTNADNGGTAALARFKDSNGVVQVSGLVCGVGGAGDVQLSTLTVTPSMQVEIVSATITHSS